MSSKQQIYEQHFGSSQLSSQPCHGKAHGEAQQGEQEEKNEEKKKKKKQKKHSIEYVYVSFFLYRTEKICVAITQTTIDFLGDGGV